MGYRSPFFKIGKNSVAECGGEIDTVLYGAPKRDLIRVLEIVAHRYSAGYYRDFYIQVPQQSVNVKVCRVAFHRRAECEKNLSNTLLSDAIGQITEEKVIRSQPVNGRDESAKDVVASVEMPRALYGHHIADILHDANNGIIASRIAADGAYRIITDIVAALAEVDLVDKAIQVIGEVVGKALFLLQQKKSESEGSLPTYSG